MGSTSDPCRYELRVLRAPGDGVEPAILLKAPGRRAEYLFNVPDGFSRLALEHKSIPSGRLSCVLLSSLLPKSVGGLGGLMLRLKQDGHGQVQVVGPRGSSQIVHSLRHICRWRHPRVIVSECREDRPAPVFVDEFVAIVPLVAGDGSALCPWCACPPVSDSVKVSDSVSKGCDDSTSSSDDDSSSSGSKGGESPSRDGGAAMARFLQSGLGGGNGEETFEKRLGVFNSSTDGGVQGRCLSASLGECEAGPDFEMASAVREVKCAVDRTSNGDEFCGSLRAQMEPGNSEHVCEVSTMRNLSETSNVIEEGNGTRKKLKVSHRLSNGASLAGSGGGQDCNSHIVLGDCCRSGVGSGRSLEDNSPNVSLIDANLGRAGKVDNPRPSAIGALGCLPPEDLSCVPAYESCTINRVEALTGSTNGVSSLRTGKPFEWEIRNSQLFELPEISDESNPVFECSPSCKVSVISSLDTADSSVVQHTESPNPCRTLPGTVLGFVCYLRKFDEAIIFVACDDVNCLESLWGHPALACVHPSSGGPCGEAGSESIVRKHNVGAVVHLGPHSVLQSSEYKSWMHSFRSPVHVMTNDSSSEFGFQSSLATLKKLNGIDSSIFPLPRNFQCKQEIDDLPVKDLDRRSVSFVSARLGTGLTFGPEGCSVSGAAVNVEEVERSAGDIDESMLAFGSTSVQQSNGISGAPFLSNLENNLNGSGWSPGDEKLRLGVTELRPTSNLEWGPPSNAITKVPLDESERNSSSVSSPFGGNNDAHAAVRNEQSSSYVYNGLCRGRVEANPAKQGSSATDAELRNSSPEDVGAKLDDPASDFQLTFLGTGCAEPSKKRGSSGILLQVKDALGSILLDAGEGTVGQLRRRFGGTRSASVISSLQALWLSHKHGDHVLGALSILHERSIHAPPLIIFGPEKVWKWLSELSKVWVSAGLCVAPFQFVHCEEVSDGKTGRTPISVLLLDFLDAMRLESMKSVKVHHCYEAYGLVVKGRLDWSVVYSGDTRPCRQLIESGRGCTLLIHEATFEDPLIEQARQKRHSTVSEARQVGLQMSASHIILTHFSQRYPEIVAIDGPQPKNVALAFDGMVVPSGMLRSLGTSLPLIRESLQKASDDPRSRGSDGRISSKPVVSRSGVDAGVSSRGLKSVKAAQYSKPVTSSQHKRWLSDSDEEMDNDVVASSIKWDSDSEEEASSQGRRELIMRGLISQSSLYGCARDARKSLRCKSVEDDGLGVRNGDWRRNGVSRCSSGVAESFGPFGSKHLRWTDSDSGSGSDS